jgi:hypothetical protein
MPAAGASKRLPPNEEITLCGVIRDPDGAQSGSLLVGQLGDRAADSGLESLGPAEL